MCSKVFLIIRDKKVSFFFYLLKTVENLCKLITSNKKKKNSSNNQRSIKILLEKVGEIPKLSDTQQFMNFPYFKSLLEQLTENLVVKYHILFQKIPHFIKHKQQINIIQVI